MTAPSAYLLIGLVVSFLGTLPFGPVNLAVVKTTVDYNVNRGIEVAVAAALVEMAEAFIAVSFGVVISAFLENNTAVRIFIALAFIVVACMIFTQKSKVELHSGASRSRSMFVRGLAIAAVNPQAIPFWIFAFAVLQQYLVLDLSGLRLVMLIGGIFTGKLLALIGFACLSTYLKLHLQQSRLWVNRVLAAVLLLIGVTQLLGLL